MILHKVADHSIRTLLAESPIQLRAALCAGVAAHLNDVAARLLGRDLPFAVVGLRMAELMSPLDHNKAERELGWKVLPVDDALRRAADWFRANGYA